MRSTLQIYSLIGAALLFLGSSARATTFTIADGDVTGLKNAIATSNTNALDDTIVLATNGNYVLTVRDNALNGLPAIAPDGGHNLTIQGNGATITRSSAGGTPTFRIFYVNSGANVTLSGLTITNGNLVAHGGAIYNDGESGNATLTITNCTISGNTGDYGGAIYNDGESTSATLIITDSTFTSNSSANNGGVIFNDGGFSGTASLTITGSTFSQNASNHNGGGAIQHDAFMGTVTGSITNCTFSGNSANAAVGSGNGGAIYIDGEDGSATLSVINCTFSQNTATTSGGGFYNTTGVDGGIAVTQIGNTIFKTGVNGANIVNSGGTITSLGHNLSNDSGGGFLTGAGDQISTDPMLDPAGLQNNGGPTPTIALVSGSLAVNQGNDSIAPGRDQRSYVRNGTSDIGAFELGGVLAPIATGSNKAHGAVGTFALNLPLTGPVGIECRSGGPSGIYQLAMSFATPVTLTGTSVQSGTGMVSGFTVAGSQVTVNLTGVTNAQHIIVRLTNVNDGVHTNNVDIPMDVLAGDTNADRFVDAIDTAQTKSKSGQAVNTTNFREDVNTDGFLDAVDTAFVKSKAGTALTGTMVSPPDQPAQTSPKRRSRERSLSASHQ